MIDLLVPSFKRPGRLAKMYASAKVNATSLINVNVWAAFEYDDPFLSEYKQGVHYDNRIVGSWNYAAPAWNALASASLGDIVHMAADDLVYNTPGWDTLVTKAMEGHPERVLHYEDHLRPSMACNPFVSRQFINTVGFIHPGLRHFYSDTWIEHIARYADTLYFVEGLVITQEHFKNKMAGWDETYAKTRAGTLHADDTAIWKKIQPDIIEAGKKVKGLAISRET